MIIILKNALIKTRNKKLLKNLKNFVITTIKKYLTQKTLYILKLKISFYS